MKTKTIKTEQGYILVDLDATIQEGDSYFTDKQIFFATKLTISIMTEANKDIETTYRNSHYKIIGSTIKLPNVPFIEERDEFMIGEAKIYKLADDLAERLRNNRDTPYNNGFVEGINLGYDSGYKQAKSEGCFSENQLIEAIGMAQQYTQGHGHVYDVDEILKFIKPTYEFVVEMEDTFTKNNESYIHSSGAKGYYDTHSKIPKITGEGDNQILHGSWKLKDK